MIGPAGFMRAPNTHEGKKSGPSACYARPFIPEQTREYYVLAAMERDKQDVRGIHLCIVTDPDGIAISYSQIRSALQRLVRDGVVIKPFGKRSGRFQLAARA